VRRGGDGDADDDERGAHQGDVPPAQQVGEGADEGADGCEGEEVGEDEPDPAVCAADVGVDVWGDAAEEVDGDLGAGPEEGHGDEGEEAVDGHWGLVHVVFSIA
jgi:hypothetical protein